MNAAQIEFMIIIVLLVGLVIVITEYQGALRRRDRTIAQLKNLYVGAQDHINFISKYLRDEQDMLRSLKKEMQQKDEYIKTFTN